MKDSKRIQELAGLTEAIKPKDPETLLKYVNQHASMIVGELFDASYDAVGEYLKVKGIDRITSSEAVDMLRKNHMRSMVKDVEKLLRSKYK